MIKIEKTKVVGLEEAIRGMRNPMNSWDRSDSYHTYIEDPKTLETAEYEYFVGPNDYELMCKLARGGSVHAKYRRMINVYVDITAPLFFMKELDTYKVGTVTNSCSTMHKIHAKEFVPSDFSYERLNERSQRIFKATLDELNYNRQMFLDTNDKMYWEQMIILLPSSYNQRRTMMLNYEVLVGIYRDRKNHKLKEWHDICDWIKSLPYSEIITGDYDLVK